MVWMSKRGRYWVFLAVGLVGVVAAWVLDGAHVPVMSSERFGSVVAVQDVAPSEVSDISSDRRIVTSADDSTTPLVALAQPFQSFESTLEASFRARSPFSAAKFRTIPPTYSVSKAIAAKHLNPEGKRLNALQQVQLRDLLLRQAEEENKLHREDKQAREQAFLRAIQRGSYRECSVPTVMAAGTPSEADSEALMKEVLAQNAEVTKQLESTWGREHQDWTRTYVPVAGADGRLRQYVVFYARQEEPGTFAAWDRVHERFRAHRQQLKDFFAAVR
jgi:hypothetical protein